MGPNFLLFKFCEVLPCRNEGQLLCPPQILFPIIYPTFLPHFQSREVTMLEGNFL